MVVIIRFFGGEANSFLSPDSAGRESCPWALSRFGLQRCAFLSCQPQGPSPSGQSGRGYGGDTGWALLEPSTTRVREGHEPDVQGGWEAGPLCFVFISYPTLPPDQSPGLGR